ncbi:MAG: sigma-70 family RNA polymerase sigma factor [Planctomycetota bacterium]|nr:MAG: sigma-70 family RNA polymerase sigma factor [Planctomycetota bacterium]
MIQIVRAKKANPNRHDAPAYESSGRNVEQKRDEQLLAEHLEGRPGAFDELVERYSRELFGFLCRFAGNAAAAEDIIQDTFVQVHLAAHTFDPARSFKPWLYTIAANKARDYLRSRSRRQEYSLDAQIDEDGPSAAQNLEDDAASQEEEFDASEQRALVQRIVNEMPEHFRMILTLGYFQQLPYAEIATILDIPVGTVKSRLHAAVNHFAKLYKSRVAT